MRTLLTIAMGIFLLAACSQPIESPPNGGSEPPMQILPTETDLPLDLLPTKAPPAVTLPTLDPGATKMPPIDMPTSPLAPQPEDSGLERATVNLDYVNLLILESYPVQINIELQGYLPTPCHNLRVTFLPPDAQNRIYGEVYTVVDPTMMCIQVIKEFETTISLGSFPTGHYQVYVNGELVGEFDS